MKGMVSLGKDLGIFLLISTGQSRLRFANQLVICNKKSLWTSKKHSAAVTFSFSLNITFGLPAAKRNLCSIHRGVVYIPKAAVSFPRSSIKAC